MKEKIKPCPFCGSEVEIRDTTFGDSMILNYTIECLGENCCMSPDVWVEESEIGDLIKEWNTRTEIKE